MHQPLYLREVGCPRASLDGHRKFHSCWDLIWSPERPAHSKLLYQLSYVKALYKCYADQVLFSFDWRKAMNSLIRMLFLLQSFSTVMLRNRTITSQMKNRWFIWICFTLLWNKHLNKPTSPNNNNQMPILGATPNIKNWTIITGSRVDNQAKIIFELGTAWIYYYSTITIRANSWNILCYPTHPLSCLFKVWYWYAENGFYLK